MTQEVQPSVAKDLLAGTIGGIAQVIAGQPFDLVKVRLQSSSIYNGPVDVVRRVLGALADADLQAHLAVNEGPLAFYAGTTAPLIGIGACVALQFTGLEAAKRHFAASNASAGRAHFSGSQLYASGAFAGAVNAFAAGPVEHIRIRMQTQGPKPVYSSTLDAVTKIYRSDGLRGIYQGQGITVLRELHGYGIYFATYELLAQRYRQQQGTAMPSVVAAGYGAVSGITLWLNIYPIDVVKSKLQTDALPSSGTRRYRGAIDCFQQTLRTEGARGFIKGLLPTMIRAPVANAAVFVAYQAARAQLG